MKKDRQGSGVKGQGLRPRKQLTHFDEQGAARMVDVSAKAETVRVAVPAARVTMEPATLRLILDRKVPKGDVLAVARVAGIMAAKRTAELIPMCHPLNLSSVEVAFSPDWPAMMRTYWKNEETYQGKFKNGWYLPGDRARIDKDGYFWFIGRDDDIINTAGHLVSPFEVESALLEHPAVAESAVVSKPDEINMEVVKAFVTL